MPGDDLKKVARGAPLRIPAAAYNSFIDAAADYRNRTLGNQAELAPFDTRPGIIYVRNDSGGDRDQFSVLGLDDIVISPDDNEREFKSRVVLSGVTPEKESHLGRFCILAEPIKSGKIGRAFVDDICQVKLNVPREDEEPRFADIDDGEIGHLMAAVYGSATILWREGGTGVQWAVVRIGRFPSLFPVKLEQYGGEQGDDENPATWTYNVIDPVTGEEIEHDVDPVSDPHKWQRPEVGWMIEATFGYAHFKGDGELVLGWINEMVDQEPCEESGSGSGGY